MGSLEEDTCRQTAIWEKCFGCNPKGELTNELPPGDDLKRFIGGRGLGIKLLTDLAPHGVDPLAPENPLIFATGPYTGKRIFGLF